MQHKEDSVAHLMRHWRQLLKLSTAQAGDALGLSDRAIEDIEQGRRRDGDVLTQIALQKLVHDAATAIATPRQKKARDRKFHP